MDGWLQQFLLSNATTHKLPRRPSASGAPLSTNTSTDHPPGCGTICGSLRTHGDVGQIECTIQRQIEEREWVATSYTLTEANDVHMGILFSRVVAGKITESFVVARTISEAEARLTARKAFN